MLCFTVYFTRVNVTSVSVKQPFIWWRHSIDFQSFQNPNLFKHQTLREKQTACTKLSGDQSICLLCAFFHLKGGCGGILPNFWAAFTGRAVAHGQSSGTRTCATAITSGFSTLFNLCWLPALRSLLDLRILHSSGHRVHLGFVTVIFSSVHATATFSSSALQVFAVRFTPVLLRVGWWWYCSGFAISHFLLPVHT